MTAFTNQDTAQTWRPQKREAPVRLYLAGAEGEASTLVGVTAAGFPLELNIVPITDWIDPDDVNSAAAAVVQVDAGTPASIKRFERLVSSVARPLIAASYDPPLSLVRSLLRTGASDVLPLPLDPDELETSLKQIVERSGAASVGTGSTNSGKVVSAIKTSGGVGATSLLCQLAARFASSEAASNREVCLLDFDLQFGDVAFQLGLRPNLSLADLMEAGGRLDGALIRATTAKHATGLYVVAAPSEIIPVEGLSSDDLIRIVDVAAREFGTAMVDLPTNWTNWSMSILARSDLVLPVSELSVPSLHRARRQLDLLRSQGLGELEIRVVINRFEKRQLRTISRSDVREALGNDIDFTIADDAAVMRTASERGMTIDEVKRRSSVGKDINVLDAAIAAALGLER